MSNIDNIYIGKNILNIIIIGLVLYFVLYTYYSPNNKESFDDASNLSTIIINNINNLSNLINQQTYKVITNKPTDGNSVYYDLTPKFEKLTRDVLTYKLYCNDNSSTTYIFSYKDSKYILQRVQPGICYGRRSGSSSVYNRNSCTTYSTALDISDITNNISAEISKIELTNNKIREIFTISPAIEDRYLIFTLKERNLNINKFNAYKNDILSFVNNYKNISNIFLDTDYYGLFLGIKNFTTNLIEANNKYLVYNLKIDISNNYNNYYKIQCWEYLNESQIRTSDKNIFYNITNNGSAEYKWWRFLDSVRVSFIQSNNKFYLRRLLENIDGGNIKRFDKKCDITTQINNIINNFREILPVNYTSITPSISSDATEIRFKINLA